MLDKDKNPKRKSKVSRGQKQPFYKALRKKVLQRDNFKCQFPGCGNTGCYLEMHHIKKWAEFPRLRFVPYNCITLCRKCHTRITGQEKKYEDVFFKIVYSKSQTQSRKHGRLTEGGSKKKKCSYRNGNKRYTRTKR